MQRTLLIPFSESKVGGLMTKFSFAEDAAASSISIMTEKTMRSMIVIVSQVTKKATVHTVAFEERSSEMLLRIFGRGNIRLLRQKISHSWK
jgi:hypothetical protein